MTTHALFHAPGPVNEPNLSYAPGTPERAELRARLEQLQAERSDIPCIIGGEDVRGSSPYQAVMPHKHAHVLADVHRGGTAEVERAIAASAKAWPEWSRTPFADRAAIFLRAAELLTGPWRQRLNAATMLNQSKTAHQAEIDSGLRAGRLLALQPLLPGADLRGSAAVGAGRLEPDGVPAARGLRACDHALQLHLDRRQPPDQPGPGR